MPLFYPKDTVEICSKEEGFLGSYYAATFLAAIGKNRCLVQYKTRFTDDENKKLLTTSVDMSEMRPLPPCHPLVGFSVSDRVDAYADGGWWVGNVVGKVVVEYDVRLDINGNVLHLRSCRIRIHLDWEDGKWVYPQNRAGHDDGQAKVGEHGS